MKYKTIKLSEVHKSMGDHHFGPPAKVGWLAAICPKTGGVLMTAGKAAYDIFFLNAKNHNCEIKRIVKG